MFEMSLQYVMLSARLQGNPHIAHHVFVDMYVSVDDVFNNPLHSLPSDDCRAVLVQLIKLACSKISVPTIYIHNWGARVVQVAFYFLGFFRNISQQKGSLTRRTISMQIRLESFFWMPSLLAIILSKIKNKSSNL